MPPKKTPMSDAAIKELIAQGVADALAEYESHRNSNPNGDGSHNSGSGNGRPRSTARECTYKELLNCQPLNFKGTKGVVKGTDVVSYTQRFQELALMCDRILPEESDEVEKYIGGLPNMIQGNVMAASDE
ncbi:hypothetical protein Tco_1480421, partial [Tanacetum coccineum]